MFCGVCGSEFPDDFSFCPKCGRPVHTSALPGGPQAVAAAPVLEAEQDTTNPKLAPSAPVKARFNYGTVVFAAFSVFSLLVCLAKGIVPIYLGESALWAAVAWYWHKKSPWSETATGIVLLLAVGFAAGEGYLIGRQSLGKHYASLAPSVAPSAASSVAQSANPLEAIYGKPSDFSAPPATGPPSSSALATHASKTGTPRVAKGLEGSDTITGYDLLEGHLECREHRFLVNRQGERVTAILWAPSDDITYTCSATGACMLKNTRRNEEIHAKLLR